MLLRILYDIHGIDENIVLLILEDFSSISIIVMLNIMIHVILPVAALVIVTSYVRTLYALVLYAKYTFY